MNNKAKERAENKHSPLFQEVSMFEGKYKIFGYGQNGWYEVYCGWCNNLSEIFRCAAVNKGVKALRGWDHIFTVVEV